MRVFLVFLLFIISIETTAQSHRFGKVDILESLKLHKLSGGNSNDSVLVWRGSDKSVRFVPGSSFGGGGGGVSYSFSTGLTESAGTVTNDLRTGVSGGQTAIGGTASGNNLTLQSTSHATKGAIVFGISGYDEVNNRLGIGTTAPTAAGSFTGRGIHISDAVTNLPFFKINSTNVTAALTVDNGAGYFGTTSSHLLRLITNNTTRLSVSNAGAINITTLDTDASAPSTSGTTRMVITDANGLLSFAAIPASGDLVIINDANHTVTATQSAIRYQNAITAARTVTLPDPAGVTGREIWVKWNTINGGASINITTTSGTALIYLDGTASSTSQPSNVSFLGMLFKSDGTSWYKIN